MAKNKDQKGGSSQEGDSVSKIASGEVLEGQIIKVLRNNGVYGMNEGRQRRLAKEIIAEAL